MALFLFAMGVIVLGGLAALMAGRSGRRASLLGAGGAVTGCALALGPALRALLGGPLERLDAPWSMPGGSFSVALDPVSGLFLVPTLFLSALAAVYGTGYLKPFGATRALGEAWFCFNLLVVSMALVVVARNGVLFLVAWEVMSLASFFLVTFERETASVREAGWTYLVATHLGTAFLLAMFVLLGGATGSLEFDGFGTVAGTAPGLVGPLFLLAVIGFGTKAGFMPLHVWLPEAHPAAPSHVSAVMSGVMIKTGIYGLRARPDRSSGRRRRGGGGCWSGSA